MSDMHSGLIIHDGLRGLLFHDMHSLFLIIFHIISIYYSTLLIHYRDIFGREAPYCVIHDGPTLESPVVQQNRFNGSPVVLSSFQAVLISWTLNSTSTPCLLPHSNMTSATKAKLLDKISSDRHTEYGCLWYSSQDIKHRTIISRYPVKATSPDKSCKIVSESTICVYEMNQPQGGSLKVSINSLIYNGPAEYNDDCLYAGVSVYTSNKSHGKDSAERTTQA